MYKIKGYNPEGEDWFWAEYSPDGKIIVSGKVEKCLNCRSTNKANDYIMTGKMTGKVK
jgi:hypothetical protein